MKYLDIDKLRSLTLEDFLAIKPYPYFNHRRRTDRSRASRICWHNMPPLEMFKQNVWL